MEYITSAEMAEKLGITRRMVNILCQRGEIEGARKKGNRWIIPDRNIKKMGNGKTLVKPLPIGISDFSKAISDYYYVDKTLLIKEIIDNKPEVSLFLRPRRFGKTLNMDMLRTFFEKSSKDTSVYFQNTNIWKCGKKYREYQGKYPIVFFTFKDMKYDSWAAMFENIKLTIRNEYGRFEKEFEKRELSVSDTDYIKSVLDGSLPNSLWGGTLGKLTEILDGLYGIAPMILIDEYDTPIQEGHLFGFYNEIIGFMRNFLSGGLKDNKHLSFAFLTGILKVAKESIFSGLNNISINSVIENRYSSYFGFTTEEVKKILKDYGVSEKYEEVRSWYDGYRFGDSEIYNPWSVLSYIADDCLTKTYWQSTGSNEIIGEVISSGTSELMDEIRELLLGGSKKVYIDTSEVYPEVRKNYSNIYSFLLMGGYLTLRSSESMYDGNSMGEVAIPNKEVMHVFEKEILVRGGGVVDTEDAMDFQTALEARDDKLMQKMLQKFLEGTISFHDASAEGFYHGLLLGLSAALNRYYEILSNREAGDGRYDIALVPRNKGQMGYIIEVKALLKVKKGVTDMEITSLLQNEAKEAIKQIDDNHYANAMKKSKVYKIGAAFYKKRCAVIGE